jgi:membrane dipeptidase
MRWFVLLILASCGGTEVAQQSLPAKATAVAPTEPLEQRAQRLAKEYIIADGHVDLPYRLHNLKGDAKELPDLSVEGEEGDFDAARARLGGLDAPFMSIYIPSKHQKDGGAKKLANELIDSVEAIVEKWPGEFARANSPEEVRANFDANKISLLLGIENGAAIEDDLGNLKHFYDRGVRYITLTHAKDNLICDSSYDDTRTWKGLSPFGHKVVAEMNQLGIMVDVSHISDQTFYDLMKVTTKPVIASHSSMRHFTPGFERNMSDDMVRALAANGGVIMINFGSTFLSQTAIDWMDRRKVAIEAFRKKSKKKVHEEAVVAFKEEWGKENPFPYATVADAANHIDRVVELVGIDHVGFGSDFDGVGDSLPVGLKDASDYPRLIQVLLERGYTDSDIEKISSGNLMRVWEAQGNASKGSQ